jgi:hypothetical protein
LGKKSISPGVAAAVIIAVVVVLGFVLYRRTMPAPYTGGPIDMGAAMRGGGAAPPSGGAAGR